MDEQIRDYLSKKGVRVIELFRQWDDDQTGKIEKKEFRRGMKELGLTVGKKQLDKLFDMWDPDKTGARSLPPRPRRDRAEIVAGLRLALCRAVAAVAQAC